MTPAEVRPRPSPAEGPAAAEPARAPVEHVTAYVRTGAQFSEDQPLAVMARYIGRERRVTLAKALTVTRLVAVTYTEFGAIPVAAWLVHGAHRERGSYVQAGSTRPLIRFRLGEPVPVVLADHTVPAARNGIGLAPVMLMSGSESAEGDAEVL